MKFDKSLYIHPSSHLVSPIYRVFVSLSIASLLNENDKTKILLRLIDIIVRVLLTNTKKLIFTLLKMFVRQKYPRVDISEYLQGLGHYLK